MASHSLALVPAAYVALLRGDGSVGPATQILLQLRRNTGYMDGHWAHGVAGHVEPGESVVSTAVREAREELGIEVSPEDLIPLTGMHRTNGGAEPIEQRVDWFFACRRWSGEPSVREPDKDAGLRWFPLGDLPGLVPPHERKVLAALASGAVPPVMTFGFAPGEEIEPYRAARPH